MAGSRNRKYTIELSEWVSSLEYDRIPDRIIEKAKLQTLSVLASVFASYSTTAGRKIASAFERWADGGDCRMIPSGAAANVKDSLSCASALSIMLDYDDYLMSGHTGHSAVLAPMMLSRKQGTTGKEFLTMQVIANEVEARVGSSVMLGPLNGQMWSFIHAAGAACVAGRLLGLDGRSIARALGIALSQPPQPLEPGFFGGYSKVITAAAPMNTGIMAAQLAAEGLSAPDDIFEADAGFCEKCSFVPLYQVFSQLGELWLTDTLSYKIYPGCAYMSPVMDTVFDILDEKEFAPEDIYKIDIHASVLTAKMDELSMRYLRHIHTEPIVLNFFTPYNVAAGIIDGKLGPAQFEPERIGDRKIWDIVKRVSVHHDMGMTGRFFDSVTSLFNLKYLIGEMGIGSLRSILGKVGPASPLLWLTRGHEITRLFDHGRRALERFAGTGDSGRNSLAGSAEDFEMSIGARTVIELKSDRKVYESEQAIPLGAAGRPGRETRELVIDKFRREAARILDEEAAEKVLDMVLRMEELDAAGIGELAGFCCVEQ